MLRDTKTNNCENNSLSLININEVGNASFEFGKKRSYRKLYEISYYYHIFFFMIKL